jgi:hypothetical protein
MATGATAVVDSDAMVDSGATSGSATRPLTDKINLLRNR